MPGVVDGGGNVGGGNVVVVGGGGGGGSSAPTEPAGGGGVGVGDGSSCAETLVEIRRQTRAIRRAKAAGF